jgi:hypothetical protein
MIMMRNSHPTRSLMTALALASGLAAVNTDAQTRPRDQFVFRTVLRDNTSTTSACTAANGCMNRLIAVLLSPQMTALYSTAHGTVYVTRNAVPQDGNLSYTHTDFGSRLMWPTSNAGTYLHRNVADKAWDVIEGGNPITSSVVYKGFSLGLGADSNKVTLRHNIVAGTATVNISETPEAVTVGSNPGLQRTIQVTGLGTGQSLRLHLSGQVRPETWTVLGGGTLEGTSPVYLNIPANGAVVVTGSWQP